MKAYQENQLLQSPAGEKLLEFLQHHRQQWNQTALPDLEQFEHELHTHLLAMERDLVAEELAAYDVEAETITVNGTGYTWAGLASETYLTAAGPVTVERNLYRPAHHRACHVCPLEMRAGIVEGFFTPAAARQAAYVTAHLPPAQGAALFGELGNMQPSPSSLERLPKGLSARWEAHRQAWETELREWEPVPRRAVTLAVSLDGVMAPMRPAPEAVEIKPLPEEGPEKQPKGPKGYQEVGCGTVSLYAKDGDRLQTVRYGRMPESKKATLCQQLQAECQAILTTRSRLRLVRLADGAKENWRFLETLDVGLPADQLEIWDIVDFYHACDHLKHALDLVWGELTPKSRAEFARLRTLLKEMDGGVETVIETLRYRVRCARKAKRQKLQKELTYFRNQRHRMAYASYLREHLPIASGVVEAACKTLVTQRLKQSGMHWSKTGGQGILTLRSLIQSERWEHGWALLRESYQQSVFIGAGTAYSALPLAS
jgi:hypothetical protein